ncbi:Agmatinase [Purpureocillium takamizusanense]|uniref:Agmatinase n=1 Tax=Purpureocillium takamizusanense TaxID=2060973 RepID=A0A9Q8VEZ3_9HYPO|nr:Agmatinase [Purpureocillium takamizusanense]UNI23118.1 Agmatinase [Purpureocillium takamizusanense]
MRRGSLLLSLVGVSTHWGVPVVAKAVTNDDDAQHRLQPSLASMAGLEAPSMEHIDDDMLAQRAQSFMTFGRLPYVNCFAKEDEEAGDGSSRYDIAILGAPSDIAVTGRPGARFGPSSIRSASDSKSYGYSVFTGRDPLRDWARVVDCGDPRLSPLDKTVAFRTLDRAHELVSLRPAASPNRTAAPRVVMLGGDHSTTLSALRAVHKTWGKISVVHFDSHIDTWDTEGAVSEYAKLDHGTFLYLAYEEGLILDTSIHAGIRAPHYFHRDITNDRRVGFATVHAREVDTIGIRGVVDKIRRRVGDSRVYVTVDIDVLDPAFAPATGTPEPGGWSTRELLTILQGLEGLNIVGADVVEVAPVYDTVSQTTALAAAEVVISLLDLMVGSPVKGDAS